MMDIKTFHHSPFTLSREIRILCLRAGSGDDPLSGRLEHIELDSDAIYEALSYEWRSLERSEQILIDCEGQWHDLQITLSLASALRYLRHQDETEGERLIWADGICINQNDKTERQHQVFLMGSIYRKAWRVVTYIGQSNENTAGAIQLMDQLWRAGTDAELGQTSLINTPDRDDSRCGELRKMVLSGWAGRVWCAQEFLLNPELVLLCGRHEIEWFKLPGIVQLAFNGDIPPELHPTHNEDPLALRESLVSLWSMRASIFGIPTTRRFQLFELLCNTHPMRATDPRDKVYALLSVASDSRNLPIFVNYDCSAEQLYTSVATALVQEYEPIELLNSNLGSKKLKLPSWVPDWSCWRFGTGGMIVGSRRRASGYTSARMSVQYDGSLLLTGCVIDSIESLSDVVGSHFVSWHNTPTVSTTEDSSTTTFTNPRLPEWLENYVALATRYSPSHDGPTIRELLWSALTCKTTASDEAANDDYVEYFDAYLSVCHRWKMGGDSYDAKERTIEEQRRMARSFFDSARRRMRYRRLCGTTRTGLFGRNLFAAAPQESRNGDKLCIIEGASSWYVLRETERKGRFELIGPAYVHGFMNGEILEQWYYKSSEIVLV
jgi:hypothetical protein